MTTLSMGIWLRNTILNCTYPALPYPHHLPLWTDAQRAHNQPRTWWELSDPTLIKEHRWKNWLCHAVCRDMESPQEKPGNCEGSCITHMKRRAVHQRTCETEGEKVHLSPADFLRRLLAKPENSGQEQYLSKLPLSPCWKRKAASTQGAKYPLHNAP